MFITIIVFALILGLLIFSHELGHFVFAKKAGIKVEEFGFGLPPRIFGIKKGETIYSLNLLPLGGFVKIFGEEGEGENDPRSFSSKSISKRFGIIAAGVMMNVALAVVLLGIGHGIGLPSMVEDGMDTKNFRDIKVQITEIAKNSPAEAAGLLAGDSVIKIKYPVSGGLREQSITDTLELQDIITQRKGQEIVLVIQRGSDILEKNVVPRVDYPEGEGAVGIGMVKTGIIAYPWYEAIFRGAWSVFLLIITILTAFFELLRNLLIRGGVQMEVTGPVGIAVLTKQVTNLGFIYILQFAAFLSVNLAIINAFPFPALDGGRILFLIIEKIKGAPINRKIEKMVNSIGFAILIALMVFITFRDIVKLF